MDRPTCATCIFYDGSRGDHGFCHRNPPSIVSTSGAEIFPLVRENYWCGCHNKFVQWQLAQPVEGGK